MTDKKIIIDGVDVSRCNNYDHGSYFECNVCCCHCDEIPNCYFKQLKRKEQECRELRKQLEQAMYLREGTLRLYSERQNIKYKHCFRAIYKIINNNCSACKEFEPEKYKPNNCVYCDYNRILQLCKD